ncbi:MAG: 4Fe-4S binding protein [bacterium]|nr:4Fe-4S binding protein [bacterium]
MGSSNHVQWTRWRRLSQLCFVVFFLALPFSNRLGQVEVLGTLASLSLGPVTLVDPSVGVSSILASRAISIGIASGVVLPILLAVILGPVFCSWICPWGFISEIIAKLLRRRHQPRPHWLSPLRWSVLAALMTGSLLLGLPLVATVSAPRLITILPLEVIFLGGAGIGNLSLLGGLFVLELALPRRLWCSTLCPVGTMLVLLRWPRTLTVGWTQRTCRPMACGENCVTVCSWNIDPKNMSSYSGCTNCGACIQGCPSEPEASMGFLAGKAR